MGLINDLRNIKKEKNPKIKNNSRWFRITNYTRSNGKYNEREADTI